MRKTLLSLLFSVLAFSLLSQNVGFHDAKTLAYNFINYLNYNSGSEFTHSENLVISEKGITQLYIFNFSPEGFVILTADKRITPVVGYSLSNSFPVNNIPEHINSWLKTYCDQTSDVSDINSYNDKNNRQKWFELINKITDFDFNGYKGNKDPLLRSEWHQAFPYNQFCPEDTAGPSGYTYVGCVALAMAQVLYYYRYPESGNGQHSYFLNNYDTIKADFGNTTYKWDEMVNYTYFYPNPAAAELSFHCGVAVNMNYSPTGSGAYTVDCVDALKNYFRYSEQAKYITRGDTTINYSDSLKTNLDNDLPIIYTGGSFGGHSFICDGYNDENFFHFNFGWGGSADGYYYLESIVPGGINLTSSQAAIINIIPKENHPHYCSGLKEYNAIEGTLEDGSNYLNYQANSDCQYLINIDGADITNILIMFKDIDIEENMDFISIYDGSNTTNQVLATLTGQHKNVSITSSSNEMLIHFTSDGQNEGKGWFAEYIGYKDQFCSANSEMYNVIGFINDKSGKYFYANNSDCNWIISPNNPEHDSISGLFIEFLEFNIEENNDLLEIYNGPDNTYPQIASLSGNTIPSPITTTSNEILLNFITNNNINNKGWDLYYESIFPTYCNDTTYISSPSGIIQDGSLDKKYTNNTDCYWMIAPQYASKITFTFSKFELEWGYDRLKVYDPTIYPPALLGDFTSTALPPPVTAPNGKMLLHFHTDESMTYQGWEGSYQISNLSVDDIKLEEDIYIYPNPASDNIILEGFANHPESILLEVYNSSGILCISKKTDPGNSLIRLDISNLINGIYIIQMTSSEYIYHKKFIKTK